MTKFVVYSRNGCHLCEDLLQQLTQLQQAYTFSLQVVDIDEKAQLIELYGSKVPVVTYKGKEICCYFLDEASITDILTKAGRANN